MTADVLQKVEKVQTHVEIVEVIVFVNVMKTIDGRTICDRTRKNGQGLKTHAIRIPERCDEIYWISVFPVGKEGHANWLQRVVQEQQYIYKD